MVDHCNSLLIVWPSSLLSTLQSVLNEAADLIDRVLWVFHISTFMTD